MDNPGVIVIGGHVQGLGILRIYGKAGIRGILLDDTNLNLAKHSKYCKAFYKYEKGKLLEFILNFKVKKEYKNWMLVPTNDLHIKILSKHKPQIVDHFKVSTDEWNVIEKCYNKRHTYKIADEIGIDIPRTWMPDSPDDIKSQPIQYPCIIKPAVMHTFYTKFKTKVFICNNFYELVENYQKALRVIPHNEIIVQEIIQGGNENQFSACFMYNRDHPLVGFVAQRKRQHPLDFGNATTYAETIEHDELFRTAEKLLKKIGYKGVCEVEFKKDDLDGKFKFLEINARTWKWHSIAEKSKSPFLLSLYNNEYNLEPVIKSTWEKASFRHLLTDIPTVLRLKLKKRYTRSKIKNVKYAVWDTADIKPAFFELIYLPYLFFSR